MRALGWSFLPRGANDRYGWKATFGWAGSSPERGRFGWKRMIRCALLATDPGENSQRITEPT